MLKRLINKIDKLNENLEKSKINEIADAAIRSALLW